MSYFLYDEDTIDREKESLEIARRIENANVGNQVLFFWAETGIGKSTVIRKALHIQKTSKVIVWVETAPINKNEIIASGQYLSHIANELNDVFKDDNKSLHDFLLQGLSKRTSHSELQEAIDKGFSSIPQIAVSAFARRCLQTGSMDAEYILACNDDESQLILREYVNYVFDKCSIILVVSNFQNIDHSSAQVLVQLAQHQQHHSFIFEFTIENDQTDRMWQYYNLFKQYHDINLDEIKIPYLPSEFAQALIGSSDSISRAAFDDFYTHVISGNIYKLKEKKRQLINNPYVTFQQDPFSEIERLPYYSNVVLQLICILNGRITQERLYYILSTYQDPSYIINLEPSLSQLANYIIVEDEALAIRHPSVCDYIIHSTNRNLVYAARIAYSILRDVLNRTLHEQKYNFFSQKELILLLLDIYVRFQPNNVIDLFDSFKNIIIDEISTEQAERLIEKVQISLGSQLNDNILMRLVKICYDVGMYEKSYELLNNVIEFNKYYFMYKAMLLNRLDQHEESINLCKTLLFNNQSDNRFALIIKLIMLLNERSLNHPKKFKTIYYEILHTPEYENLLEYGFALRNAEMVFSHQKSIPYIKRSIEFFRKRNAPNHIATSKLTLAMELAFTGNTDEAERLLSEIEDNICNSTTEKHILYNDQAAVALLKENADNAVLFLLEKAKLTAHNAFDLLTIQNNITCWYIDSHTKIEDTEAYIQSLETTIANEPDKRLHRRAYINLSQYFKHVECNVQQSKFFLDKASKIHDSVDALTDYFINGKKREDLLFLMQKPYYVSFISYWHFEIPIE